MDEIKSELDISNLVPRECLNAKKIPFTTLGNEIGEKVTIYNKKGILIEDFKDIDGTVIRRLLLGSKLYQVQSEICLIQKKIENVEDKTIPLTSPLLMEEENKGKTPKLRNCIDYNTICGSYARAMIGGLSILGDKMKQLVVPFRVLILGTGAGALPMFLVRNFCTVYAQCVEINPDIIDVNIYIYIYRLGKNILAFKKMIE